jgi:hypothetical protein
MPTLSKSRFLSGNQCSKKLYFDVFRKELKPQASEQQQALFDAGERIGELAQVVFPNGRDAKFEMQGDWNLAIERTRQWIEEGLKTIYEATFSVPGGFAALDILHHQDGERWAIEVKSSASVKEYHITDASFQYFVMKMSGYPPDKFFLMHINNRYVKQGEIAPNQFFHLEEITEKVLSNQSFVQQKHATLLQILEQKAEPSIAIGKHCNEPFACDYTHHCWAHLPENNIFQLNNARGKDWTLYNQGIMSLEDIPSDFPLNHRQSLQIDGVKDNRSYIDSQRVSDFMEKFEGPLYFFDFETINPALPVLDGTRPFEQVPFQYSLHITDISGNIIDHKDFLAKPEDFSDSTQPDPRLQLIRQLQTDIGTNGNIIAYNASFEMSILKGLALSFPEEQEFISNLILRFIDLLTPFKSGWYYKPEMGASASIKSVLPAIAPEFSYADLEIGNGVLASNIFHAMIENCFLGDRLANEKYLLTYCERDTEGMVVIYRHLRNLISI